jgi:hypothetical protein
VPRIKIYQKKIDNKQIKYQNKCTWKDTLIKEPKKKHSKMTTYAKHNVQCSEEQKTSIT